MQLCAKTKHISRIYKQSAKFFFWHLLIVHWSKLSLRWHRLRFQSLQGTIEGLVFLSVTWRLSMRVMKICGRAEDHSGEGYGENKVKCRHNFIALLVRVSCPTTESELYCLLFMMGSQPLWLSSEWHRTLNIGANSTNQRKLRPAALPDGIRCLTQERRENSDLVSFSHA